MNRLSIERLAGHVTWMDDQVLQAIERATSSRIHRLSIETVDSTLVMQGVCDHYYLRKAAIDIARAYLADAVSRGVIRDGSIDDQIVVRYPSTVR